MSHCQIETSWYSQTREIHECCVVGWIQWEQLSILASECWQTKLWPKVQSKEPFVCYMQHVHKEWNVCMTVCCGAASWLSQCLPTGTGIVSVSAHRVRNGTMKIGTMATLNDHFCCLQSSEDIIWGIRLLTIIPLFWCIFLKIMPFEAKL